MLVALFRAPDDAERTAARLSDLGHEALLAPVLEVVPIPADMPAGPFGGVIFTSAHGVEALRPDAIEALRALPCFCVGERTAEVAGHRGFRDLRVGQADAERLAAIVSKDFPKPARLLLVAGRDRKPAIERRLGAARHGVVVATVYEASAASQWPELARNAFETGQVAAALHYSRRSAELALCLAWDAGVEVQFGAIRHHCLSEDAAGPLRDSEFADITIAPQPSEDSLLKSL